MLTWSSGTAPRRTCGSNDKASDYFATIVVDVYYVSSHHLLTQPWHSLPCRILFTFSHNRMLKSVQRQLRKGQAEVNSCRKESGQGKSWQQPSSSLRGSWATGNSCQILAFSLLSLSSDASLIVVLNQRGFSPVSK